MTTPLKLLLVLRTHWQVKVKLSGRQLPELILAEKITAILFRILWGSTCDNVEILVAEVLPKKMF